AGGTATEPQQEPYGLTADGTDDQGTRFYLGQFPAGGHPARWSQPPAGRGSPPAAVGHPGRQDEIVKVGVLAHTHPPPRPPPRHPAAGAPARPGWPPTCAART